VKVLLPQDIWDSIEVRGLLEGGVARLAAERLVSELDVDGCVKFNRTYAMGEPTIENFPADLDLNDVFARAESLAREHAQLTRRNLGIIMADTDVSALCRGAR
jgi:hypothetical protein